MVIQVINIRGNRMKNKQELSVLFLPLFLSLKLFHNGKLKKRLAISSVVKDTE